MGSRAERDKSEESGKEVLKACAQNISWNFAETTSHYPTQCLSTRRRRGKKKLRKTQQRNLQFEKKENPSKVFHKRIRSGDLAARRAAPQSFIDKEMRSQLFHPHQFATRGKEKIQLGQPDQHLRKTTNPTKTTVFH